MAHCVKRNNSITYLPSTHLPLYFTSLSCHHHGESHQLKYRDVSCSSQTKTKSIYTMVHVTYTPRHAYTQVAVRKQKHRNVEWWDENSFWPLPWKIKTFWTFITMIWWVITAHDMESIIWCRVKDMASHLFLSLCVFLFSDKDDTHIKMIQTLVLWFLSICLIIYYVSYFL